jgi:hypothetical protein
MASTKVDLSSMGNFCYDGLHSNLYLLAKLENMSMFVVCVARRFDNDFKMTTRTKAKPEVSPTNINDQMVMTAPAVGNDEPIVNSQTKLKKRKKQKKGK